MSHASLNVVLEKLLVDWQRGSKPFYKRIGSFGKASSQALAGLVVDREEATFLEVGFSLEEDLFFSRVFFGALIVIERLSSCLAVVGGLAWFCLWLTEELEDG